MITPAYCHFCHAIDDDWIVGDVWQHRWCGFRIPAKHIWHPPADAWVRGGEQPAEPKQLDMFADDKGDMNNEP